MYDSAYIDYLAHLLGTRDYFECHEILEEHWKKEIPLERDSIWVAFIQLAVALYHHRRGNYLGGIRLIKKSQDKFHKHRDLIEANFGLQRQSLFELLDEIQEKIIQHKPYESINLPINDAKLKALVQEKCKKWGCQFESKSNLNDEFLIHKHKLRER
ncbi:hypothetical protein HNQ94_003794 [Salirhabdus euzebyi]|uniref:DUF309 domain-containing protein n=1 Tax=Salirhabdus euzebyi TaxID=394506 RepID=A0A841QAI3_9BACI|nr:DUF309 domain-containing protein [Salirhabdus euzebyi]MBB6455294.1 hypothetical protein [Salirhabdus euzebyi]